MSTSYYALRAPAAALRPWKFGSGKFVYDKDDHLIASLHDTCLHWIADRDNKVAHRDNGGDIVVYATRPDDQQAISEYGELVTLGQLRRGEAP